MTVECGQRLQHTIAFTDEATPTRKAKPAGVLGAEIWDVQSCLRHFHSRGSSLTQH